MINRTCNFFIFGSAYCYHLTSWSRCFYEHLLLQTVIPEKMSTRQPKEITMTLISLFCRLQGKENPPWNLTFHGKLDFFLKLLFFFSPMLLMLHNKFSNKLLIVISWIFPHSVWARFYIHISAKELNLLPHPLVIGLLSFLLCVCGGRWCWHLLNFQCVIGIFWSIFHARMGRLKRHLHLQVLW